MGEKKLFNSHSSDKRGIAILVKNDTPISDIEFENTLKRNFSKLTFKIKNEHVLVKCIYAPNKDMNTNDPNKESTAFFQKVFDDSNEDQFTHRIIVGDYNVALNHKPPHVIFPSPEGDRILEV